ncbi:hypothetical protein GCM10020219_048590 [Nonomuraea dietziae]
MARSTPAGRLDDVGHVALARVLLEEGQVNARRLAVRGQVEVGAVGDALELAPLRAGEVEAVLHVDGALGVVRQLLLGVLVEPEVVLVDAQVGVPAEALVDPVLVPLLVGSGLDEELHLHLLELAGAEDEVARRDLVAEGLADLADAERDLLARRLLHVGVVDEDALRRLGTQVGQARLVLDRAEVGLQQAAELARLGEGALVAAVGAAQVRQPVLGGLAVLLLVRLDEVVGAEALVAGLALGQRVGEGLDVAAGLPHLGSQDDAGVEADHVFAGLDHRQPPLPLDVVLQLHAQRTVVPRRAQASVDLARRVDEPPSLGEADDRVHDVGPACHWLNLFPAGGRRVEG